MSCTYFMSCQAYHYKLEFLRFLAGGYQVRSPWYEPDTFLLTTEVFGFTSKLISRLTCRAAILLSFVSLTRTSSTILGYTVSSWDCDVSCVKEAKEQLPN